MRRLIVALAILGVAVVALDRLIRATARRLGDAMERELRMPNVEPPADERWLGV